MNQQQNKESKHTKTARDKFCRAEKETTNYKSQKKNSYNMYVCSTSVCLKPQTEKIAEASERHKGADSTRVRVKNKRNAIKQKPCGQTNTNKNICWPQKWLKDICYSNKASKSI